MPGENATSEELSENKDDGDSGSGFKLNAVEKKQKNTIYIPHTQRTTTMLSSDGRFTREENNSMWFDSVSNSIRFSTANHLRAHSCI